MRYRGAYLIKRIDSVHDAHGSLGFAKHGTEFCGRPLQQPFELYLAISQLEHRRITPGSPESNGFC